MDVRGRGQQPHECLIGVEALGRPNAYSTDEDSSVRRRAYALRRKLDEVYARELIHARVRIVVPKGSYVPFFVANGSSEVARDSFRLPSPPPVARRTSLSAACPERSRGHA